MKDISSIQKAKQFLKVKKICELLNKKYPCKKTEERKIFGIHYPTGNFWEIYCSDPAVWYKNDYQKLLKAFKKTSEFKLYSCLAHGSYVEREIRDKKKINQLTTFNIRTEKVYYEWDLSFVTP